MKKINQYIDHTLLKADATDKEIAVLCSEAVKYGFASVCVNPCYVKYCAKLLSKSLVKVCTVVGFPLGANKKEIKLVETQQAVCDGADELDMVINVGAFKSKKYKYVLDEMKAVREVAKNKVLKVIIETACLTKNEIVKAANLVKRAEADFVKTSTGFAASGAVVSDIKLLKKAVGRKLLIKASGGIKTREQAIDFIKAGASRIGSSKSLQIVCSGSSAVNILKSR